MRVCFSLALLRSCGAHFITTATTPCGGKTSLGVVRLPSTWLTPDTFFDTVRQRLHVVYGTADKNAYYAYSDDGATFSRPTLLNTAGLGVTTTMGERGPKIARGVNSCERPMKALLLQSGASH